MAILAFESGINELCFVNSVYLKPLFSFVLLTIGFCVLFLECYINAWAPHWGSHSSHVRGRRSLASCVRPDIQLPSLNTNNICSKCSSPWTAKINKKLLQQFIQLQHSTKFYIKRGPTVIQTMPLRWMKRTMVCDESAVAIILSAMIHQGYQYQGRPYLQPA